MMKFLQRGPGPFFILDSSFNPPTLAHRALLLSLPTRATKLLLLSTTNADKPHAPASYAQRSQMMLILSRAVPNSAVALIDRPTFAEKAREEAELKKSTWVLGWDTLVRFFADKYYPEGSMGRVLRTFFVEDGSRVVYSRRGEAGDVDWIDKFLDEHQIPRDCVQEVEIDPALRDVSSSAVRAAIKEGREWKGMVTDEIADYIEQERLYID
ncbi:Nucleotidylyl transferase [Hymenopellis radicata]|nr:Nucleotidylyl transferase [Hymenopellis radicata]